MPLWVYESEGEGDKIFGHGIELDLEIHLEYALLNGQRLDLATLKARSDFYAFSRYVFPFYKAHSNENAIVSPDVGYNALGFTELTSIKIIELAHIFKQSYPIHLIFLPESKNFLDAIWLVTVDKRIGLHSNIEAERVITPGVIPTKGFNRKMYTPRPVVRGPSTIRPNETVTLNYEYYNYNDVFTECDFKSYIKTTAGYLPHNVVQIKDGKANINFTALGLDPGDEAEIKFSIDKVYSNAVQHKITVI